MHNRYISCSRHTHSPNPNKYLRSSSKFSFRFRYNRDLLLDCLLIVKVDDLGGILDVFSKAALKPLSEHTVRGLDTESVVEIAQPTEKNGRRGRKRGGHTRIKPAPMGCCQECGTTSSPEWRNGPAGVGR